MQRDIFRGREEESKESGLQLFFVSIQESYTVYLIRFSLKDIE